jgi:hypothetical protein
MSKRGGEKGRGGGIHIMFENNNPYFSFDSLSFFLLLMLVLEINYFLSENH